MDEEDCLIVSETNNLMSAKKFKQGRLPFTPVDKSAKKKRKLSNDDSISKVSKLSCPDDHSTSPFSKLEHTLETTELKKSELQTSEEKQSFSMLQPEEKENIDNVKSLNNEESSIDKMENVLKNKKENTVSQEKASNMKECTGDPNFKSKNMKIKFFNSIDKSIVPAHNISNDNKPNDVSKKIKLGGRQIKSSDKLNKTPIPNPLIEMFQKIEEKGCKQTINTSEEIDIVDEIQVKPLGNSENTDLKQCNLKNIDNPIPDDNLINKKLTKNSSRDAPVTPISSKRKTLFATLKTPVFSEISVESSLTPIQNPITPTTPTPNLNNSIDLEDKSPGFSKTPICKRKLNQSHIMRESEKKKKREEKEKLKIEKDVEKKQKEEEKRKAKEEKTKLKLEELEAKRIKREEEKQKKDEERQKKEEEKQKKEEERQKKEEERQKKEEEDKVKKLKKEEEELEVQEKKKKEKAKFAQFFLSKKSESPVVSQPVKANLPGPFMKFQVKENMRMAPIRRQDMISEERKTLLDLFMKGDKKFFKNYLEHLKDSTYKIGRSCRTYPALGKFAESDCEILDDDEVEISGTDIVEGNKVNSVKKNVRAKFLQFCENKRPAFYGTWSKKPQNICGRNPFGKEQVFDYAYDSDEDWEEEETGESLSDSEGEGEGEEALEENDQYEVDNDFFVPHGYLSDDEGKDDNEVEDEEVEETGFKDETMQKEQLKQKQAEFELEMKQETKKLKPKVYGCVWMGDKSSHSAYDQLTKILSSHRSMILFGTCPIRTCSGLTQSHDDEAAKMEEDEIDESGKVKFAKSFPESAVPDLIRLIHGNAHTKRFLIREFSEFWKNKCLLENSDENCNIALRKIEPKIQELGTYGRYTEDGISHKYRTWYVSKEVREKYGLSDLDLKNSWTYTIPPKTKRHRESLMLEEKEDINVIEKEENEDKMECESGDEPLKKSSAVNLITRFTKVLSEEEKEELLKKSMLSLPNLIVEDKNVSNTKNKPICNAQDTNNVNKSKVPINSTPANKPKKKIALLSVPRNAVSPNNCKPKNSIMSFLNVKEKVGPVKSDAKINESSTENCITID